MDRERIFHKDRERIFHKDLICNSSVQIDYGV